MNRMIKLSRIASLMLVASLLAFMIGCSADNDDGNSPEPSNGLVGVWHYSNQSEALTYQFDDNGTWRVVYEFLDQGGCTAFAGDWTANDDRITLASAGGGSVQSPYSLQGDQLDLGSDTTDVGILTFTRVSTMLNCDDYTCAENFINASVNGVTKHYGGSASFWNESELDFYFTDWVSEEFQIGDLPSLAPGTYPIGTSQSPIIMLRSISDTYTYYANSTMGSGEIVITESSDSCVSGTFHGVLVNSGATDSVRVETGEFSSQWVQEIFQTQNKPTYKSR